VVRYAQEAPYWIPATLHFTMTSLRYFADPLLVPPGAPRVEAPRLTVVDAPSCGIRTITPPLPIRNSPGGGAISGDAVTPEKVCLGPISFGRKPSRLVSRSSCRPCPVPSTRSFTRRPKWSTDAPPRGCWRPAFSPISG
jgi:hypothetical protein